PLIFGTSCHSFGSGIALPREIGMTFRNWRVGLMVLAASSALAGCLPDAEDAVLLTPAPAETPPNRAPTISGDPVVAATVGTAWSFQPVVADAAGDVLSFKATGLPGWANLNLQNGAVSGTPSASDAGTTAAIVISVSDGEATASLPAFSVTVTAPPSAPPAPAPAPIPPPILPAPPPVIPAPSPAPTPPPTTPAPSPAPTPPPTPPAPSPAPTPPPTTPEPPPPNTAPVISGSPSTTVQATRPYVFTPSASDAETQSLAFSIRNRP